MDQESPHVPVELDFPCHHEPFNESSIIVGSCDGLFCICSDFGELFMWNPSTVKLKQLPFSGSNSHHISYLTFGFGYNECQDDYKVVEVIASNHNEYGFQNEFRVYSSRTDSWERIEDYASVKFCFGPAKFVNGRLHWIVTSVGDKNSFVSSLNLVNNTPENVALPYLVEDGELGTLGGHLCLICDHHKVQMDLWVMLEYGVVESWTKVASIPYLTAIKYSISPIFISQNDEILLQHGSNLLLYNSKHNTFKHPQFQIQRGNEILFTPYMESLVSSNFV